MAARQPKGAGSNAGNAHSASSAGGASDAVDAGGAGGASGASDAVDAGGAGGASGASGADGAAGAGGAGGASGAAHLGVVLALYLLGLLVGGLYVGMVSPVRTVVQASFGLNDNAGIWMINIYTLFYAALIPVVGKLADRRGRSRVFTACLAVFAAGSLLCGLAKSWGGFGLLLAGRVVQAAGAGGMIPVANAAIATTFPAEKRGMALGLAAAVAGLANVLGAAVGSAVIGVVGIQGWDVMFFLAVPLCAALAVASAVFLRKAQAAHGAAQPDEEPARFDWEGSALLVAWVLLLLLGIKGLDFADLAGTLRRPEVWVTFVAALACIAAFGKVERRAQDPVFHMEYLHSRPIVITMVASFFVGCTIISMMLVPQYAAFAMGDPLGSGGYYVLAIGAASLVGPPLGGKLIDRFGPKPVLASGLVVMVAGFLFLAFVASVAPSAPLLIAGLAVVGFGMGFAMGAPTNYMVLENTDERDGASAVATIALVRQVGTSLAPAVLVSLIASAPGMLGYQRMLVCVACFCLAALVAIAPYRSPRREGKRG